MLKKRIKVALVVIGLGLVCLGVYKLSEGIVKSGYSSEDKLYREKQQKEENQKVVISDDTTSGVHNSKYTPGTNVYMERLNDFLYSSDSPYNNLEYNVVEQNLDNGEKKFIIKYDSSVVLTILGNDVDYTPYMFIKDSKFSEEEKVYYENLGNGEEGYMEDTNQYYWVFK